MNTQLDSQPRPPTAFTLIELLVVIAIIGVLAGLMLPVGGRIKQTAQRNKARANSSRSPSPLKLQEKLGHYPPDAPNSPNRPRINPLFFELLGTKLVGGTYETLDGSGRIPTNNVASTFGTGVNGFINCTRAADADDAPAAQPFLRQLKPTQYGGITPGSDICVLTCSIRWPDNHAFNHPGPEGLEPLALCGHNPTNNRARLIVGGHLVGGKTTASATGARKRKSSTTFINRFRAHDAQPPFPLLHRSAFAVRVLHDSGGIRGAWGAGAAGGRAAAPGTTGTHSLAHGALPFSGTENSPGHP
jgi:prepilin-type N-terminal cleavage/methylation domain-containing protein